MGLFSFEGVIGCVNLEVLIKPTGSLRYAFNAGELDRDHEPGARDANYRRRQWHELGQGPQFPLKRGLPGVIRFNLIGSRPAIF
jgi:hypothetical protein